jgi:mRNA interferase RelE/StbE
MAALYGFAYTEVALRFLESKVPSKFKGQIKRKIEALATDPFPAHRKLVQGVGNGEEVWRIRSGDYRVLYVVRDVSIVILDIDHRKDVYR